MWDLGAEYPDTLTDAGAQGIYDVSCVVRAAVHHRQQNAVYLQARIDRTLHL